ncbi:uncharacterized protein LOC125042449 [Penaeus chinensis]|uniref:uncharacterized protein LOC125042449 n=1 Tax=Penaeus chinensis TaxID=139456 RepID=UPI001FB621CF|nr:uncharacterized protein LOC125042449 [Penaeus chinensis]
MPRIVESSGFHAEKYQNCFEGRKFCSKMKSVHLFLLPVAIIALVVFDIAMAGKDEENQLVLVDIKEDEDEATVADEETPVSNPVDPDKIFIPSKEWQMVQEGKIAIMKQKQLNC